MATMGRAGQVQEQAMEEILASIRRVISEGDPDATAPVNERRSGKPAGNVALRASPANHADVASNVVELAIAQAMEGVEAEMHPDMVAPMPEAGSEAPDGAYDPPPSGPAGQTVHAASDLPAAPPRERVPDLGVPPADERRGGQPLLSPRSDAMVSSAFNRLASTMLSGSARTVDELVEDLLRPMLRNWLDVNLPPLVERLVRDEIERVARGKR